MNLIDVIKKGGVILYPSDTLWGLGGDATHPEVHQKINEIKKRPAGKPYIILVSDYAMLQQYVDHVPPEAWEAIEKAVEPLTVVFPKAKNLPSIALAEDGSVAIRVVKRGFAHDLIKVAGVPLISTSANISGHPVPLTFSEIDKTILEKVDYIVHLHREKKGIKASKIIRILEDGTIETLRD